MCPSSRSSASRTSSSSTASSASSRSSSSSETGSSFSGPPPSCQPATPNSATACERPRGAHGLVLVGRVEDERTLGQDERRLRREARSRDGDADGARMVAGRERLRRAHVEDDRLVRHRARRARAAAERRGTRRGSARRSAPCSAAAAAAGRARAARKSASSPWSAGLKRRSKPIVVDAFELIAAPQSEPATWPGKTSTPSPELDEPAQAVEEALGSLLRLDREIRADRRRRRRASRR